MGIFVHSAIVSFGAAPCSACAKNAYAACTITSFCVSAFAHDNINTI